LLLLATTNVTHFVIICTTFVLMVTRSIAHMDLDTFFVSCERLLNSKLNDIPLIIGGGDRGVVASCSYEARLFGVRSAMPIRMAMRLCPQARIVKGDMDLYSKMSNTVTQIIEEKAPIVEKASIDEFYLDLTGMDKLFGCYKFTDELVKTVTKETGLPLSFAVSVNKTVSKIGTGEGKPVGRLEIPEASVQPFLNPLSIQKIPMVGRVTFEYLSRIGIRTIEKLAEMPPEYMQQLLGKNGLEIWRKSHGIDDSPVEPYRERKTIGTEKTYERDTMDVYQMKADLLRMVESLCFQLRNEKWLTSVVTVKIKYANFDTETKQRKIAYTSADHTLSTIVSELFDSLFERRMRLRLVGVRFGGLVRGQQQINLFEDTEEKVALYQAMDKIKRRFGMDAIGRCAGMNLKSE